jgi:hypothetical protein
MIKHISYLQLNPRVRAQAAERARTQLRAVLTNTVMTPESAAMVNKRLADLDLWEHGKMPEHPAHPAPHKVPAQLPERTPEHHVVEVSDNAEVHDHSK